MTPPGQLRDIQEARERAIQKRRLKIYKHKGDVKQPRGSRGGGW